jgi:hypothetical protein
MSRAWKVALLLAAVLLLLASVSLAQESKPVFTSKDRELIEAYYNHLIGMLAPGSLDRTPFPLCVEKTLAVGRMFRCSSKESCNLYRRSWNRNSDIAVAAQYSGSCLRSA